MKKLDLLHFQKLLSFRLMVHDHLEEKNSQLSLLEKKKRRKERFFIALLGLCFIVFTVAEFNLSRLSRTLPFVNSIFFFGLLNINMIILGTLVWLVSRNVGKLFIERRRNILGSQLKTKLVLSFLSFSIIPTLVLFVISALYIHSSFDKWFSVKVQNTLQTSLDITGVLYRNTEQSALHFAQHISEEVARRYSSHRNWRQWMTFFLSYQRNLLSLDSVEFYEGALAERFYTQRGGLILKESPRLPVDLLDEAFRGKSSCVIQHIGSGDLIRCLVSISPLSHPGGGLLGVLVVSSYIPVSLRTKVDEISTVLEDYKDTNPLKYPMKSMYFILLVMMTLMILFVAIWVGLYMARELMVPIERLMRGVQSVGAGNLDTVIVLSGQDEISVLVESFNKMTADLKESRKRLLQSQREMAWREVARRIAHEIKNPLTPIQLSAQRLQRRLGDSSVYPEKETALLNECTDIIIKHTGELKDLVNEFSQFARLPEISPAPHSLNGVVEEGVALYRQAHPEILIVLQKDEGLPIFEFDRDQMKRVVINLLENATAAVLSQPIDFLKKIHIRSVYHEPLQLAVLEIQDNGPGMKDEVRERVFEPYFSTKPDGTGLGLTIVKRIVNDHEGFVRVKSSEGEGTQFLVEIPVFLRHS